MYIMKRHIFNMKKKLSMFSNRVGAAIKDGLSTKKAIRKISHGHVWSVVVLGIKISIRKNEVMLISNSINCYMQNNIKIIAFHFTKLSFTNIAYRDMYWMYIPEELKYIKAFIVFGNNNW